MATSLIRMEFRIPFIPGTDFLPLLANIKQTASEVWVQQLQVYQQSGAQFDVFLVTVNVPATSVASIITLISDLATALGGSNIISYQYPVTQN